MNDIPSSTSVKSSHGPGVIISSYFCMDYINIMCLFIKDSFL